MVLLVLKTLVVVVVALERLPHRVLAVPVLLLFATH